MGTQSHIPTRAVVAKGLQILLAKRPNHNAVPHVPTLECLLVPDQQAARRRVRRRLAEVGARSGILVDTWAGLLSRTAQKYFTQDSGISDREFEKVLGSRSDAFWSESLTVAPRETSGSVKDALTDLVSASDPSEPLSWNDCGGLTVRVSTRIADLSALATSLEGRLPGGLARIQGV